jgi:cation diffusion facilitator CzcD-associated flavoprotein CzcO
VTTPRVCVIGAGAAGIAAARSLSAAGMTFDWFERDSGIGGNWREGVYDSTCLISSRDTSGFPDLPMPASLPTFPRRQQVHDYQRAYADHFGLTSLVTHGVAVEQVVPCGGGGADGWQVRLSDGRECSYDAVVVANGHLWDPHVPDHPGAFAGKALHSRDYRGPADLKGERVLVVGAGNSGCDLAVEAAQSGHEVELSIRRGHWFVPKSILGVPRAELQLMRLPRPARNLSLRLLAQVAIGRAERYGLPKPDHRFGVEPPVVSSQLFYYLDHGAIHIRPAIERLADRRVQFADGTASEIDTILWATGYRITFPFLDRGLLRWVDGVPARIAAGTLAPDLAGLYFVGLVTPGGGNFPVHHAQGRLVAELIAAQAHEPQPVARTALSKERPSSRMYAGVSELLDEVESVRRTLAAHRSVPAGAA